MRIVEPNEMQNVDIDRSSSASIYQLNLTHRIYSNISSSPGEITSRSSLSQSTPTQQQQHENSSSISITTTTTSIYDADAAATLRNFYFSFETKLAVLPVLLMVAGTFGNCLAFYVLTRKRLRNQSTMLYFATLTLMDTLALYQWNFNFFYKYKLNQYNQNLEEQSLFLCRYVSFMAYFSMQTSAWILTAISIDRYLIVSNHNWKQKYSRNMKFNLIVIGVIVSVFALINLPVTILNGRESTKKRVRVECYTTAYMRFWQNFTLLFECLFPLMLMIVFNYLLIKRTLKSSTKLRGGGDAPSVSLAGVKSAPQLSRFSYGAATTPVTERASSGDFKTTKKNTNNNKSHSSLSFSDMTAAAAAVMAKNASFNDLSSINDSKTKNNGIDNQTSNNPKAQPIQQTRKVLTSSRRKKSLARSPKLNVPKGNSSGGISSGDGGGGGGSSSVPSFRPHRASFDLSSTPPPPAPQFVIVRLDETAKAIVDEEECSSKLEIYQRVRNEMDSEHDHFETMINSITGSLASLDFLDKRQRDKLAAEAAATTAACGDGDELNEQTSISDGGSSLSVIVTAAAATSTTVADKKVIPPSTSLTVMSNHSSMTITALTPTNKTSMQLGVAGAGASAAELSTMSYRPSICDKQSVSGVAISRSAGGEARRRISYNRNRRIVVMLSLLTLSFAISTLPSAIFYTFFRTMLENKPYRRLLSIGFNLLRHLSHAFNFIIYFTSSSVIKQQLSETFSAIRGANKMSWLYYNYITCCGCFKSRGVQYLEARKRHLKKRELKQQSKKRRSTKKKENITGGSVACVDPEYEMNFMHKTENIRRLYAYASAQQASVDKQPSVVREISFISIDHISTGDLNNTNLNTNNYNNNNTETIQEVVEVVVEEHTEPVKKSSNNNSSSRRRTTFGGHTRKSSLINRDTRASKKSRASANFAASTETTPTMNNSSSKTISFNVPKLNVIPAKPLNSDNANNINIINEIENDEKPQWIDWF